MENQTQQQLQTQENPQKSIWGKWWFWVIIIFVIIIIGSGDELITTTTQQVTPTTTTETETTQEPAMKEFYSVGEAINIENRFLTVNSVKKDWKSSNKFDVPSSPNKKFVVVNVTLENKGSDKISFNEFKFYLLDANGVFMMNEGDSNTISGRGLNWLGYGELAPGRKKTGDLIYEVDESGLSDLILIFMADFGSKKTVKVKLQ